jgi:hypothetical protein
MIQIPVPLCEVRRPVGEKSVILILRKNRPVQHTSECEVRRPVGEKSVILILRKNCPVQHTSEI